MSERVQIAAGAELVHEVEAPILDKVEVRLHDVAVAAFGFEQRSDPLFLQGVVDLARGVDQQLTVSFDGQLLVGVR